MSKDAEFENFYTNSLNEIYNQQLWLLQKKAKLLENESSKANLTIDAIRQNDYVTDYSSSKNLQYVKNRSDSSHKTKFQFKTISKKQFLFLSSFIIASLMILFIVDQYVLFDDDILIDKSMKSKFVIENLRGDTIDTMKSWRILPDDTLNVNLINGNVLTVEQYDAVDKVITSMDSIQLDDYLLNKGQMGSESTYYLGWAGAMSEAAKINTVYSLPVNFNLFQSSTGEGHIIIDFSNLIDVDGFSGYTRSVLQDGEILKSHITIYDIENLEPSDLATIIRHEFGHALGLGHSTDPEDLMAPTIMTEFPYISECDVDAMRVLYNGHESGMVICEK